LWFCTIRSPEVHRYLPRYVPPSISNHARLFKTLFPAGRPCTHVLGLSTTTESRAQPAGLPLMPFTVRVRYTALRLGASRACHKLVGGSAPQGLVVQVLGKRNVFETGQLQLLAFYSLTPSFTVLFTKFNISETSMRRNNMVSDVEVV